MLLPVIELACNQALEHDPASLKKLVDLAGHTIALEIKGTQQKFAILPQPFGVQLANFDDHVASVTLAATPSAMINIARYGMDNANLEPGELEINGDPIVAQRFAALAAGIDVDWEGLLAEHLGEVPASFLTRGFQVAQGVAEQGKLALKAQVNKTLNDDLDIVAQAQDVESFIDGVDDLRAAVDRLEARLQKVLKAS